MPEEKVTPPSTEGRHAAAAASAAREVARESPSTPSPPPQQQLDIDEFGLPVRKTARWQEQQHALADHAGRDSGSEQDEFVDAPSRPVDVHSTVAARPVGHVRTEVSSIEAKMLAGRTPSSPVNGSPISAAGRKWSRATPTSTPTSSPGSSPVPEGKEWRDPPRSVRDPPRKREDTPTTEVLEGLGISEETDVSKEETDLSSTISAKGVKKTGNVEAEPADGRNDMDGEHGPEEQEMPKVESAGGMKKPQKEEISKAQSAAEQDVEVTRERSDTVIANTSIQKHTARRSEPVASEWSHMQLAPKEDIKAEEEEEQWQAMPAYAPYDIYDDDNKLVARERNEEDEEDERMQYGALGGAGKGYTRVQMDEDAQSATSMDDNTAYLFKEGAKGTNIAEEDDDDLRDATGQMQATKELLTEGQRIAYVGTVRLTTLEMLKDVETLERTRKAKKAIEFSAASLLMWSQKVMLRLHAHMDIGPAEQVMIEQLAEHGVHAKDLTPQLMINARIKDPVKATSSSGRSSVASPREVVSSPRSESSASKRLSVSSPGTNGNVNRQSVTSLQSGASSERLPAYNGDAPKECTDVKSPSEVGDVKNLDIDIRWTVLCDLFLVLIGDGVYDSRSRQLLEKVGQHLEISWLDICRFEKRVTDALEMQEAADKENWNEEEHMATREKNARNRRLVVMGLATVGGSLVIGLSAGLLAPVIGAGLAAGFTTIGVAGTGSFLAGAGGAAIVTTTGVLTGGTIGVRAADRRTGAVKTFEYRPLHNNKRVNLIVTISGWMNGKVDDVRLPFSTVDPIMGDIYSIFWEPEMLQSMGQTISILATEALTQTLQQILGSTILIALMAAIQLPVVLTKLAYLIDNPWNVSLARADLAGLILADSLIDRNLGSRPITLVGFSLGARVIFSCLKELARKGQPGLIQNVYIFGAPVIANKDDFLRCRSVVSGRFLNGYATNDWILGYLFRATGGGIRKVAGLTAIDDVPDIENVNVTELVPGHMAYRAAMPRLLREVGWEVESDEFTEIEDPDPDNHETRQRELISEIEEARRQLDEAEKNGKEKKGRWWEWRKKKAEKKEWETYDERSKQDPEAGRDLEGPDLESKAAETVLFDIEAIRREVKDLAGAEDIQVKEIQSTLPPMRIDMRSCSVSSAASTPPAPAAIRAHAQPQRNSLSRTLSGHHTSPRSSPLSQPTYLAARPSLDDGITLTFETPLRAESSLSKPYTPGSSLSLPGPSTSATKTAPTTAGTGPQRQRPVFRSAQTSPPASAPLTFVDLNHNAWADEEGEGEIKMTFA